jgi:hypothetical protein
MTTPPVPNRHSVLVGAAWSIPAVAAATLVPVASASTTTTLTFDRSTYSGTLCADITGAYVTVTANGTAAAGTSVTVTASTGYRFENGAATFTGVSDTIGRVDLPTLRVHTAGSTGVLTATTTDATATATLTSPASTTTQGLHRRMWIDTGAASPAGTTDATAPTGSRAVGTLVTLDPSGVLRRGTSTVASTVTSASAELEKSNYLVVTYVDSTGMHRRMWTDSGAPYPSASIDSSVPAGSVAVGTLLTLGPDAVLRKGTTSVATGVTSAFAELDKSNYLTVTYVDAAGMHRRMWTDTGSAFPSGSVDATVPADSTAVGTLLTLDPSGVLRKGTNTVATGVTSAFAELDKNNAESVTWVDGSC